MAAAESSARDAVVSLVQQWLSPVVAVLSSYDVDAVCHKNNLSLCDMLLPFSQLSSDVSLKDPSNQSVTNNIKNVRIDFRDLRREGFLLSSVVLPQVLSETVKAVTVPSSDSLPERCEWYECFCDSFLRWTEPMEHEFLRHYLACILVVSTNHDDPLDQLTRLSQSQHAQQHKTASTPTLMDVGGGPAYAATAKWFVPNIFKYHLLVHDVSDGDDKKAESVYQSMKMSYGAHACHLLRINSGADDTLPDLWLAPIHSKYLGFEAGLRNAKLNSATLTTSPTDNGVDNQSPMANGELSQWDGEGGADIEVGPEPRYRTESIPHALSNDNLQMLGLDEATIGANRYRTESIESSRQWQSVEKLNKGDKHGTWLSASDRDRIGVFVQEFTCRGLVPFVERQMRLLHDQLTARNRPVRGIISGAKKWFGSSSSLAPNSPLANNPTHSHLLYPSESIEMQCRRLADLAFLFQQYPLAFHWYDHMRRDFMAEQAWLYCAGALEMVSVTAFMLGPLSPKPYPQHNMEQAINYYLNTCKRPLLATRCAMLSTKILSSLDQQHDAAAQYIRMTSSESDLSSALFLEQASLCFHRVQMQRKYALHMVLAGHRFSKAGNKRHAIRCYQLAAGIYVGKGWHFAEDHIHYTVGHQALGLGDKLQAASYCARLLYDGTEQLETQQRTFVKDYLDVLACVCKESSGPKCPDLPLPVIDSQMIRVFLGGLPEDTTSPSSPSSHLPLERVCFTCADAQRSPASLHQSIAGQDNKSDNSRPATTPVSEAFCVQIPLFNPLQVSLALLNISLQCSSAQLKSQTLDQIVLSPGQRTNLSLSVVPGPHLAGSSLSVTGLQFKLCYVTEDGLIDSSCCVEGRQSLSVRGRRLNNTKQDRMTVAYGADYRLDPRVSESPMPLLKFAFTKIQQENEEELNCLCGELVEYDLLVQNVGVLNVDALLMAAEPSACVTIVGENEIQSGLKEERLVWTLGPLNCNQQNRYKFWIKAPETEGSQNVTVLFYYENRDQNPIKHRISVRRVTLHASSSLSLRCRVFGNSGNESKTLVCLNVSSRARPGQQRLVEFHLLRLALLSGCNARWSLTDAAADLRDVRLNQDELDNICCHVSKSPTVTQWPMLSERWLCVRSTVCDVLPWRSQVLLNNNTDTQLALLWKAHVVESDGSVRTVLGEQWTDLCLDSKTQTQQQVT